MDRNGMGFTNSLFTSGLDHIDNTNPMLKALEYTFRDLELRIVRLESEINRLNLIIRENEPDVEEVSDMQLLKSLFNEEEKEVNRSNVLEHSNDAIIQGPSSLIIKI